MMAKISRGCGIEKIRIALAVCLFGLTLALPKPKRCGCSMTH